MRSRYAAFAIGDAEYLWSTLHADHDDRAAPRETFLRALRAARGRAYPSLAILDARRRGREAEVLFFAGLTFVEIGALRGVSERTVQRDWDKARILLFSTLRE